MFSNVKNRNLFSDHINTGENFTEMKAVKYLSLLTMQSDKLHLLLEQNTFTHEHFAVYAKLVQ